MERKDNIKQNTENRQIELRSDKTRRFIDEEPPILIRYGTIIVIAIIMGLLLGLFTLKNVMQLK